MKKKLLILVLIGFLVLPTLSALAQWPTDLWGNQPSVNQGSAVPAPRLGILATFNRIIDWMFTILLIVAAMYIIMAAFSFITAQGDVEKVAKARQFVLMALVGVAVAFMARGLVDLIARMVGNQ